MKIGDDFYGWGVFAVPIERSDGSPLPRQKCPGAEPSRRLVRDVPWKALLASLLLTVLSLTGILFLNRMPLESADPSEPQPIEFAVRIFEEPPTPAPLAPAELSAPEPEEIAPIAAIVIPEEPPPVLEKIPTAPPPEPERTEREAPARAPEAIRVQPPPAEVQLPKPSRKLAAEPKQRERPAIPQQPSQVAARQEAVLPELSRSSYEQRSAPASASMPKRTAALRNETASVDLGGRPQRTRSAERGTEAGTLPEAPKMVLDSSEGADMGSAPRMNARYENIADSPAAPLSVPKRTGLAAGGGEGDIDLPKATAPAASGSRKTVAMLPPAERDTSFAGIARNADPDLTGPAVQTASLQKPLRTPDAPGNSYEFLDRVGPQELDRSVMVSLNRLRTCLDPNEELTLKTRLAGMLSGPGQCRSGGVIFDIRHPESAYSIHIDLYNYEQREFQDRCSALRQAVYSCEARR